jgi:hypothetical protein
MKPLTVAIIGALVVAVAVLGYLYYSASSRPCASIGALLTDTQVIGETTCNLRSSGV